MNITKAAVEKQTITYFATVLLLIAGIGSFYGLGQLEDPEFTVKTAVVTTTYPGASPEEVELEVTDRIEVALQEMSQIKHVSSISRAGRSLIKVDILPRYKSGELGQVWDELRKKVRDVSVTLPPGASTPVVTDDFGDVYGFVLALTGDGFDYKQLKNLADSIKKELSLIDGVSRVELWGTQDEVIYLDVSRATLAALGLPFETLSETLQQQNKVVSAGNLEINEKRLRIETLGTFKSVKDIEELVFYDDRLSTFSGDDNIVRLGDIANVRRGYLEPPIWLMRYNQKPALGIAISNVKGANIVDLGALLEKRLNEIIQHIPVGLQIEKVAWQSDIVKKSIDDFVISLLQAIVIVLVVLWLSMGLRMAIIIGIGGLFLTIVGTFIFMNLQSINLQRMSLGALIIAMGMMVDNAIVVADGLAARLQAGMNRTKAAIESATQPSMALLGATVIAVMAFYPIFASTEDTGEYCASLFTVIAISLLLSWVLSVTITPLLCMTLLPAPKSNETSVSTYNTPFYRKFRALLVWSIKSRKKVISFMIMLLLLSFWGFQFISKDFFPSSTRPQLMIDYWAPEGTRIQETAGQISKIEARVKAFSDYQSATSFVGQGPPRFYLPVDPELPYSSYGQVILSLSTHENIPRIIEELNQWSRVNLPNATIVIRRFGLGPSNTWKVEARFSGPAKADPKILRELANQGIDLLKGNPYVDAYRTDWRERTQKIQAHYEQSRGRWAKATREDVAYATQRYFDGSAVGQYREGDTLIPIVIRHEESERQNINSIATLPVKPQLSKTTIPLSQVVGELKLAWEDPIIWRWDRRRAISVQATPKDGVTAPTLRDSVVDAFESIELPPGYTLEWAGDYESTVSSQQSLMPGMIPAIIIMAMVIVTLFNALRPPLIIVCAIPFAMIGITIGLLITHQAFGFMALLGTMSLGGMMIKNAIVLLDQANIELAQGKTHYEAIVEAAVLRLRPVMNAAATTILGVVPLLQDVFWVAMAITIMFGLAAGTAITMILVPVLYSAFYKVKA